jgi:subtilisin family serine protease
MSLTGHASKALDDAATAAFDAGHIVTVSAGNNNGNACNFSPAGAGGKGRVITVMASVSSDARLSPIHSGTNHGSNYGTCGDVYAPGHKIVSAFIGSSTATTLGTGTSSAAPLVAGVAAQLLQKYMGHPKQRDMAVKELFEISSKGIVTDIFDSPNRLIQTPLSKEPVFFCYWSDCFANFPGCPNGWWPTGETCRHGGPDCSTICFLPWEVSVCWASTESRVI